MLIAPLTVSGVKASQAQTATQPIVNTSNNNPTTNPSSNKVGNQIQNGQVTSSNSNQSNTQSNDSSNNSNNNAQLDAIKSQIQNQESSMQTTLQQAQKTYKSLPKSQRKTFVMNYEKQQKPAQQKLAALQKKYVNAMTPEQRKQMQKQQEAAKKQQKAAQKKLAQQLQKAMKAQQEKQKKQMLKTAQSLFLVNTKNHEVYTTEADINKTKQGSSAQPVPGTTKKYMSVKRFNVLDRKELLRARFMYIKASRIKNKAVRSRRMMQADDLFKKFDMVLSVNPQKSKNNTHKKNGKRKKDFTNHKRRRRTSRLSQRMNRSTKRNHTRRIRRSKSRSFTVKEGKNRITYLRSMYRHGNYKAIHKSGFARGKVLSGNVHTMFDSYLPNSRRAVIPHGYRIYRVNIDRRTNQPATVWLVGHHTNNVNKINHMRQAYYYRYNKRYGGWVNVGFGHN